MKAPFVKIAAILALCAAAGPALSQATSPGSERIYPSKPIRIVVGIAPGGALDITTRLIGAKLHEAWGQPVLVENKPGSSAAIASDIVARSVPDGYTLIVNGTAAMTINPLLFSKLSFDTQKDFVPISTVVMFPMLLVVHPSVPANSVQEFIAYAKANPGKLNFSGGTSFFQLAGEMFKQMTGTNIVHVPYKGSAPAVKAVAAGEVQMTFSDPAAMIPFLKAAKMKALGVTTSKRINDMPELPTLAEAGVPGYVMSGWIGMFAPAATPRDIVSKLNAEVTRIVKLPDVREKLTALGLEPHSTTVEELATMIRDDIARYGPIVKAANMKVD